MECIRCLISDVCKIKDILKEASSYGDLTFENCKVKASLSGTASVPQAPTVTQLQEVVTRTHRTRDFREASNAIRNKEKEFDDKVTSIRVLPDNVQVDERGHINCPTCGGKTTQDDLKMCTDCNDKIVCSNCGTEHEDGISCEECWTKK